MSEEAIYAIILAATPGICAAISAAVSDTKLGFMAGPINRIGFNVGKAKNAG